MITGQTMSFFIRKRMKRRKRRKTVIRRWAIKYLRSSTGNAFTLVSALSCFIYISVNVKGETTKLNVRGETTKHRKCSTEKSEEL